YDKAAAGHGALQERREGFSIAGRGRSERWRAIFASGARVPCAQRDEIEEEPSETAGQLSSASGGRLWRCFSCPVGVASLRKDGARRHQYSAVAGGLFGRFPGDEGARDRRT